MITQKNFKELLRKLNFEEDGTFFYKIFAETDAYLKVDFKNKKLIYPEDKGFVVNEKQTCNFSQNENFVVFECVYRLFAQGYKPKHIELEPKWKLGHGASGGRADILVKDNSNKPLLIIECKTAGKEFRSAWNKTLANGGQLFTYVAQERSTQFVCLYASDFIDKRVIPTYHLIRLKDNEHTFGETSQASLFYEDAKKSNAKEIYRAWKDTYKRDFTTKGLFEVDTPAYKIGKTNYSTKDLNTISSKDIQGKYYEFATILRQHNVSGRENAFDKLVNLLLCKIVDETTNPRKLKFYWKGVTVDNYFDLQDRLQKLYQEGMKRFLGEEVTYIDNEAIDNAFRFFKNDPDATRDTIKKFFRQLKFFTNSDFAFIDVHNEKLFYQNGAVLLKIVRMLQDIRLKTNEANQFLGDMFESFLDQGIKQSEGQYFTPMPIVKFILKSLPLENIINQNDQIPKVIDYACGAGHFLNEYAQEIKPIVEAHKETPIEKYYAHTVGIEKEYRLSKVAKVSAFMYGQDDINIVYADALAQNNTIKNNDYNVLVANPPYSVKGFLETLPDSDKKKYELLETIDEKSYANNNSIETFFIERAKQLLKPLGVAGIIVPSSILTKGKSTSTSKSKNVYVSTREILLKYFDIVAIAEFGSGTFGKTGTNTVTLFLRRKKKNPTSADQYSNQVNFWFNGDETKDIIFENQHFVKKYCQHQEITLEDYKALFYGVLNENLLENDLFQEYKKTFYKWNVIKKLKTQKVFKLLSKEKQEEELQKRLLRYIVNAEKDKLYYFMLASLNPQKVLIIKSPTKSKEIKEFLGYEWSAAKGNSGIQYIGDDTAKVEVQDIDEESQKALKKILSLSHINTLLYDPKNINNSEKINTLIAKNFNQEDFDIPENLQQYVSKANLVDMLDFSRPDFNKSISLTPKKKITFDTKWELEKIANLVDANNGLWKGKKAPFINVKIIRNTNFTLDGKLDLTDVAELDVETKQYQTRKLQKGDIIIEKSGGSSTQAVGRVVYFDIENGEYSFSNFTSCLRIKPKTSVIVPKYLFLLLNSIYQNGDTFYLQSGMANLKNLDLDSYLAIKIPMPPKTIQQKIVDACNAIDKEEQTAIDTIEAEKKKIEALVVNTFAQKHTLTKLAHLALINPSKKEIQDVDNNTMVSFVGMAFVSEEGYIAHKENKLLKDVKRGSYRYFQENDIIVAKITPCMENGKCAIATNLSNQIGFGSSEFHVFRINKEISSAEYIFNFLNRSEIRINAHKNMTGSSGHRRVPASFYEDLQIPIPSKKEQALIVKEIDAYKMKIKQAQQLIAGAAKRKEAVIKSFL
ncbi:MAG: N-6 DNA methylase [Chitinophagales bacterium]